MNISAPFILRPVMTTLLTVGVALAGALGYNSLAVDALPRVDFPTIQVSSLEGRARCRVRTSGTTCVTSPMAEVRSRQIEAGAVIGLG